MPGRGYGWQSMRVIVDITCIVTLPSSLPFKGISPVQKIELRHGTPDAKVLIVLPDPGFWGAVLFRQVKD